MTNSNWTNSNKFIKDKPKINIMNLNNENQTLVIWLVFWILFIGMVVGLIGWSVYFVNSAPYIEQAIYADAIKHNVGSFEPIEYKIENGRTYSRIEFVWRAP